MEDKTKALELCKYDRSRDLDYYVSNVAIIVGRVRGVGRSTHAYVKELRKALQTLVFSAWGKTELIPIIAKSNVPDDIYSNQARECFEDLLKSILIRFYELTKEMPAGARIRLMNMLIDAVAETASRPSVYTPVGKEIINAFFSSHSEFGGENE
ncbi:MAG: hypothetical protein GU361_06280 [Desulfurococcales archaeon]|jgi:hypothetical protein|nr:hypothetical protein [Fervidicoccaceae archaeon]NAZ12307.1 hypothetical protein [Desulfurococcales archaeon]